MLDFDELYFNSAECRDLLDKIGREIEQEDIADRSGDPVTACEHGLKAWACLLELMEMAEAKFIYELDKNHATIYYLLYWATTFADELHNAGT